MKAVRHTHKKEGTKHMIENNNQAHDIWLNARMNPGSGLLETEGYGNPDKIVTLMGAALARIAHEGTSNPRAFIVLSAPEIATTALNVLKDIEELEGGKSNV